MQALELTIDNQTVYVPDTTIQQAVNATANNGVFAWTVQEIEDVITLGKYSFLAKYEGVAGRSNTKRKEMRRKIYDLALDAMPTAQHQETVSMADMLNPAKQAAPDTSRLLLGDANAVVTTILLANLKELKVVRTATPYPNTELKLDTDSDVKRLIETAIAHRNATLDMSKEQYIIDVVVPEEVYTLPDGTLVPIGVFSNSDFHLGHQNCDMEQLIADQQLIGSFPYAYYAFIGDGVDNAKSFQEKTSSSLYEAIIAKPDNQFKVLKYVLALIPKQQHLCIITGNHERRSFQAGNDQVEQIATELGIAYGGDGCVVKLHFGMQIYVFGLRHKYRNSNGAQALITSYQYEQFLDVGIIGHHHNHEIKQGFFKNTRYTALKNGTYLTYRGSPNYEAQTGLVGEYGVSACLLYPDRKEVTAYTNYKSALETLALYHNDTAGLERLRSYLLDKAS